MKTLTVHTTEIDDTAAAVLDIKNQLSGADFDPSHTFGVFFCHYEFVLSGTAEAICKSLPFTVCGATSSLIGTNTVDGELLFSMMVVSGEEIESVALCSTPPLSGEDDTAQAFSEIFTPEPKKAALVYIFAPDFLKVSGDALCDAYNKTGYGVPLFGTYAVDDSPLFNEQCFTYTENGFSDSAISFLRVYGDISPVIGVCSIPKDKIIEKTGIVTNSRSTRIYTIGDIPAAEFLEDFGLAKQLEASGAISALSLIVNTPGESDYYSRTLLDISKDGSVLTGGELAEGSQIRIGLFDREGMLNAAYSLLEDTVKNKKMNAVFIHACATRNVALGSQGIDEILVTRSSLGDLPFMLSYAGGEIAPTKKCNAFFHNQSFCICAF
jgi:hypothetical protein